jgi:hypothetical protein
MPAISPLRGVHHEILYQKTDWVIGDFTGTDTFIGQDRSKSTGGIVTTTQASAPFFDVRGYRQIQLWAWLGTLTGGTSPYIQFNLELSPTSSASLVMPYGTTSASGLTPTSKALNFVTNVGGSGWTGVTSAIWNGLSVGIPFHPPYLRVKYWTSGSPTGITNAGVVLYGIR